MAAAARAVKFSDVVARDEECKVLRPLFAALFVTLLVALFVFVFAFRIFILVYIDTCRVRKPTRSTQILGVMARMFLLRFVLRFVVRACGVQKGA